jgi:hypothetical protein
MTTSITGELGAMAQIEAVLTALAEDERSRVLQWVNSRFKSSATKVIIMDGGSPGSAGPDTRENAGSLADLFDAAAPPTEADRALVVAYWLQFRQGAEDLESQAVNSELKHLGHGVLNITRALDDLKTRRPALIIQTRKSGSTKQARKRYRVTAEGKKAVEHMLVKAND